MWVMSRFWISFNDRRSHEESEDYYELLGHMIDEASREGKGIWIRDGANGGKIALVGDNHVYLFYRKNF